MHPTERRVLLNAGSPPAAKRSLGDEIERWTKLGVGVLGILYVLGFLVHTLYIASWGVSTVTLLRVQYIMAGVWLLMPVLLLAGATVWVIQDMSDKKGGKATFLWNALGALASFSAAVGIALGPYEATRIYSRPSNVPISELLWTALILLAFVFFAGFALYSKIEDGQTGLPMAWKVCVAVIFLVAYATRFAAFVYPGIDASIGGGRPITVHFSLAAEKLPPALLEEGKPYPLLLATEHTFTVIAGKHAVEIPRDAIKAVIYDTSREGRTGAGR